MKYEIYITADHGEGHVVQLEDWDGEGIKTFHLDAFDHNAQLSIEQVVEEK